MGEGEGVDAAIEGWDLLVVVVAPPSSLRRAGTLPLQKAVFERILIPRGVIQAPLIPFHPSVPILSGLRMGNILLCVC